MRDLLNKIKCWWRRRKYLKYLATQPPAIVVFDGINGPSYKEYTTLPEAMSYGYSMILQCYTIPCSASPVAPTNLRYIEQGNQRYYRQDIINWIRLGCTT